MVNVCTLQIVIVKEGGGGGVIPEISIFCQAFQSKKQFKMFEKFIWTYPNKFPYLFIFHAVFGLILDSKPPNLLWPPPPQIYVFQYFTSHCLLRPPLLTIAVLRVFCPWAEVTLEILINNNGKTAKIRMEIRKLCENFPFVCSLANELLHVSICDRPEVDFTCCISWKYSTKRNSTPKLRSYA